MKKYIVLIVTILFSVTVTAQELPKTAIKLEKLYSKDYQKSIKYANKLVSKRKDVDVAYYYLAVSYYKQFQESNKNSDFLLSIRNYTKYSKKASRSAIDPDDEFIANLKSTYQLLITDYYNAKKYTQALKKSEAYTKLFSEELAIHSEIKNQLELIRIANQPKPKVEEVVVQTKNRIEVNPEKLISDAEKLIGTKYVYGGVTPSGLDCSGFTMYVYSKSGVKIPHSSSQQSNVGEVVDREECAPGDLVFYGSRKNGKVKIQHAAMVYSNDNGVLRIIHCPNSGVRIEGEGDPGFDMYWEKRFLFVRRLTDKELTI